MDAESKRHMLPRVAMDRELLGVVEHLVVEVRGAHERTDTFAGCVPW